jgi:hypothetical protein
LPEPESESLVHMKNAKLTLVVLCGIVLSFINSAAAQVSQSLARPNSNPPIGALNAGLNKAADSNAKGSSGEVESLKHRVEEVENQNRLLMQIVTELKAKLDGASATEIKRTTTAPAPVHTLPSPDRAQAAPQPAQADKNQPARWSELVSEGNRIKFYGFLRLDLDIDSQHPNNTQIPLFITSPDPVAGGNTNGDFSMHPRLTRFGIDFSGPRIASLGDAKLSGKLETDFENGGTESRQIIRIRHAYLRLDWRDFSILAGQTWDTVSPLFPTVNNDTLQWNAGNVGDRRPQLRAAYEPKVGRGKFSFTGGIGLTGAIDALDLDNNGFRDGEESSRPDVQGRVGYAYPIGHDRSASFGISSFYGFLQTARPIAGRTDYHIQLTNADFTLPLTSFFALRGEGWWGRNMSDVRGGAGQGINVATGREIRGRGGWSEANIKVSRYLSLNPGFSTDDPVDADVPNGGRTRNRAFYLANRITPGGNFLIGADYLRWQTNYKGLRRGIDNRVNLFFQYSF